MANGLTYRKSVDRLSAADLDALRDAQGQMQQIGDNRGFAYHAGLHGVPQWYCWHHGRVRSGSNVLPVHLFLPWHRAYLLLFEHAMRDRNAAAALPWWDWTSATSHARGVPAPFATKTVNGRPNPLFASRIPSPGRTFTSRDPDLPQRLPTAATVDFLLGLTSFVDFSSQLEDVHDAVHGWTGGDMGSVPFSAYDPIFWSHHCMIDRIWYLWQLKNGVNNIPQDYLDLPLAPFQLRVRDVLNVNSLGYDYAVATASASVTVS